jgi:uncharacterized protein involved in type VI secretion and phage assembly
MRTKDLTDRLEPVVAQSKTVKADPKRASPYRLHDEPHLAKLLSDSDEPIWTKSSVDKLLPRSVVP